MLKVTMVTGGHSTGFYSFIAESDKPIKPDDACREQVNHGYNPWGYGFYSFESDFDGNKFIARWKCSTSCE